MLDSYAQLLEENQQLALLVKSHDFQYRELTEEFIQRSQVRILPAPFLCNMLYKTEKCVVSPRRLTLRILGEYSKGPPWQNFLQQKLSLRKTN